MSCTHSQTSLRKTKKKLHPHITNSKLKKKKTAQLNWHSLKGKKKREAFLISRAKTRACAAGKYPEREKESFFFYWKIKVSLCHVSQVCACLSVERSRVCVILHARSFTIVKLIVYIYSRSENSMRLVTEVRYIVRLYKYTYMYKIV